MANTLPQNNAVNNQTDQQQQQPQTATPSNTWAWTTSPNIKQDAISAYVQKKYWNWSALSNADTNALWMSWKWASSKVSNLPNETQDLIRKAAQARLDAQQKNTAWGTVQSAKATPTPVQADVVQSTGTPQTLNNAAAPSTVPGAPDMSWITKQRLQEINTNLTNWMNSSPDSFKSREAYNAAYGYAWKSVAEQTALDNFWNSNKLKPGEMVQTWAQTYWTPPQGNASTGAWVTAWTPSAIWTTGAEWAPSTSTVWTTWAPTPWISTEMQAAIQKQADWYKSLAWDYAWMADMDVWPRISSLPALIDAEQDPTKKAQLLTLYKNDLGIQQQSISQGHITWGWALTEAWQQNLVQSRLDPVALRMQSAANMLAANAPLIDLQKQAIQNAFTGEQSQLTREQEATMKQMDQTYDAKKTIMGYEQQTAMQRAQFANENVIADKNSTLQQKLAATQSGAIIGAATLAAGTAAKQIENDAKKTAAAYWLQVWEKAQWVAMALQQNPIVQKYQSSKPLFDSVTSIIKQAKNKNDPFTDKDWSWPADATLLAAYANSMDPSLNLQPWAGMAWIAKLLTDKQSPAVNALQQMGINLDNLMNGKTNQLSEATRKPLFVQANNNMQANRKWALDQQNAARNQLTSIWWIKDDKLVESMTKLAWDWVTPTDVSQAYTIAQANSPKSTQDEFEKMFDEGLARGKTEQKAYIDNKNAGVMWNNNAFNQLDKKLFS